MPGEDVQHGEHLGLQLMRLKGLEGHCKAALEVASVAMLHARALLGGMLQSSETFLAFVPAKRFF